MSNADRFLNSYRILEEELSKKYDMDVKAFGSPIVRFINDKEGKDYKDRLNLCREIRNLLTHHAEFDGERIIEPSDSMIEFLNSTIDYIKRPPLAINYAVSFEDILKTGSNQRAKTVMRKMQRLGFSHVPVIDNGEFVGIFSISTIFTYALSNGLAEINEDMLIADFSEILPPDKHETEKFKFMPPDTTLFTVRIEFEKKLQRGKRLAAVFITDNGSVGGRILGMLTPVDVINI